MIKAALGFAKRHLHVFPCRVKDKRPATANGVKDATTDLGVIERWWREEPEFNIAIATGAVSRIFVIDIDGLDAEAELTKLEAQYSPLPPTVEVINNARSAPVFPMSRSASSQFRQQACTRHRRSRRERIRARAAKRSSNWPALLLERRQCQRLCASAGMAFGQARSTWPRPS
jgi:hypothetical protein